MGGRVVEQGRAMIDPTNYEIGSRLVRPLYSYAEADRLARVTRSTSSRWLKGYKYWYARHSEDWLLGLEERRVSPPVTPREPDAKYGVSFVDLMEVAAIGRLREKGLSLKRIRQINRYCQLVLGTNRPLVTETFKVRGHDIFVMAGEDYLLNVGAQRGMQAWDEVLDPFLDTVEYEDKLVRRWWPRGKGEPVVVDPDYGFGLPVVAGTQVRTEVLAERSRAGEVPEEIAYDFGVEVFQVRAALRYELPDAA